jgi:TM2 domain-containing membrane protein YozV
LRGKVLSFNGSTGLISGDDGKRYTFAAVDLMGDSAYVPSGATVDFEPEDSTATSIYVISMAMGEKNKYVAAILACPLVFGLGMFGLHKFYLGRVTAGVMMLVGTLLVIPIPVVFVVAFLETIIYLVKSDQSFYEDYVVGDKSWF